jgi:N-acetylglucosaminyldiphosphoundecaprenol N-acetyl-beta-D-mannosaminyltransferase
VQAAESVRILGVRVDAVTLQTSLVRIIAMMNEPRLHHVVTINPEFIMEANQNPAFAAVLERADLAVPDGTGLLVAARLRGAVLGSRVPGVELVQQLAALSARHGWRVFLLGAAPGVAEAAAAALVRANPALQIGGCYSGSPREDEADALVGAVAAARSDVLLVAFGSPQQDLWIARHAAGTGARLAIGVGGTFDYLAGRVPRAPRWMRAIGLEWLYRLIQQPQRWRRIVRAVPQFLFAVLREGRGSV